MSYATISQCATADPAFIARVTAAVAKEAWTGANGDTIVGRQAQTSPSSVAYSLTWPTAIDNEAAYESAIIADNPNPGGDPSVITDGNILASVQAHWPPDPEAMP
jgi:hypothetical protein